jgi:hypothetical protein
MNGTRFRNDDAGTSSNQTSDDASLGCSTEKYVTSILAGEVSAKLRGIVKNCEEKTKNGAASIDE